MALRYSSSFDQTIGFSDTECQLVLVASAVQTYTLPGTNSHKYTILFSYNSTANVYVGYNVTPVVPGSGTNTVVARVEYRPAQRYAIGGDVISFITPDATVYMGISVRSIPN